MPDRLDRKSASAPCRRTISPGLVLLDNLPTALLYALGAVILFQAGILWGALFTAYIAGSLFWFWGRICPHCRYFGTQACPCGYGLIAPKFFQRKSPGDFRRTFRRNIIFVFPLWFLPPVVGGLMLAFTWSWPLVALLIAFALVGFVLIPLVSKLGGCRNCEIKEECPWMNGAKKGKTS